MTKIKLSFTSVAFALPLAISGCDRNPSQADNMSSSSMAATNQAQMNGTTANAMNDMAPPQMGHMESNAMHMAGSSMSNMTSNNMNMANSPQTGHMMSGSMNDMATNSMDKMAAPQTGNMESHP